MLFPIGHALREVLLWRSLTINPSSEGKGHLPWTASPEFLCPSLSNMANLLCGSEQVTHPLWVSVSLCKIRAVVAPSLTLCDPAGQNFLPFEDSTPSLISLASHMLGNQRSPLTLKQAPTSENNLALQTPLRGGSGARKKRPREGSARSQPLWVTADQSKFRGPGGGGLDSILVQMEAQKLTPTTHLAKLRGSTCTKARFMPGASH